MPLKNVRSSVLLNYYRLFDFVSYHSQKSEEIDAVFFVI